jgi:hypothetical protein
METFLYAVDATNQGDDVIRIFSKENGVFNSIAAPMFLTCKNKILTKLFDVRMDAHAGDLI